MNALVSISSAEVKNKPLVDNLLFMMILDIFLGLVVVDVEIMRFLSSES